MMSSWRWAAAIAPCSTSRPNASICQSRKVWFMTPSPDRLEPLPPALSSMWRLCKLGYRHEPRLMLGSFVLSQLAAMPDALLALWLWLLGKGVLEHRPLWLEIAAVGLGLSAAATWFLRTVSTRV